jgi:hypothetical protein
LGQPQKFHVQPLLQRVAVSPTRAKTSAASEAGLCNSLRPFSSKAIIFETPLQNDRYPDFNS